MTGRDWLARIGDRHAVVWIVALFLGSCKLDALATPCVRPEDTRWQKIVYTFPDGRADTTLVVTCAGPYKVRALTATP